MILIDNKNLKEVELDGKPVKEIYDNNTGELMWFYGEEPVPVEPEYLCIENTYSGENTVTISVSNSSTPPSSDTCAKKFEWSKDNETWTTESLENGDVSIQLSEEEKVWFRNDSGSWSTRYYESGVNYYWRITIDADNDFDISGNIMSLLDYTNVNMPLKDYCFDSLFKKNSYAIINSNRLLLPSTTLAPYCYASMFSGKMRMLTTPSLPATILAEGCYSKMFFNCERITTPPAGLSSVVTVAPLCCEEMFTSCSSLTSAVFPQATQLARSCYDSMYTYCSSITSAVLPQARTLEEMCYRQLFENCSSLGDVTAYADNISASNCIKDWLKSVSATGTLHNLGSATYIRSTSGVPTGWTVVTS